MSKLFSLKGKLCVVTGASSGIGYCISEGFAAHGAQLVMVYNSTDVSEKAKLLSEKYQVEVECMKCDLSDPNSIEKLINDILSKYERIDVFVANAGIAWHGGGIVNFKTNDELVHDFKKFIDLDFSSVYYCCAHAGKVFQKQKFGNMIITGSMSGSIVNTPQEQAAYNAAKAGVIHLGKSLAMEWAKFGPNVRVNVVSPGYVQTRLTGAIDSSLRKHWNEMTPMGRMAQPEEMVGAYVYLASDASTYTTGSNIVVDGGYSVI